MNERRRPADSRGSDRRSQGWAHPDGGPTMTNRNATPVLSLLAATLAGLVACTRTPSPAPAASDAAPAPSAPAVAAGAMPGTATPPGMQDGQPGAPGNAMPVSPNGGMAPAEPAVVPAAAEASLAKDDPLRA